MSENIGLLKRIGYILLAIGILFEIFLIYQDIFIWMKTAWFTYPPDRFGVYVPVMFISLFIYRLIKNRNLELHSNKAGLYVISVGALIFVVGYLADIHIIQATSLIFTGYGMVLYLMGSEWGKMMLFPFTFLFLMLPTISFLVESMFSVTLRNITAQISCKILNSTGSMCDTINCTLYLFNTELPVQYFRESVSSLMMHLILTYIAAEFIFIKNWSKFLYLFLLWTPFVIISHSIIYLFMGWSYASQNINLSEIIWGYRKWLPATMHIFMLIISWALIKITMRKKHYGRN
jgi:hypothetical protein